MMCRECGVGWNEFVDGPNCWFCGKHPASIMPTREYTQMPPEEGRERDHSNERKA